MHIITLDKAGRVVIPKPLRDAMRLDVGDTLELESEGEKMTLRPMRTVGRLRKKHGIWVLHTGEPLSADETGAVLKSIREERSTW